MRKQTFHRVKKTLTLLLLVSLVVSLTAASVSALSSGKEQVPSEKGACAKSMQEQVKGKLGVVPHMPGRCACSENQCCCCEIIGGKVVCACGDK